MKCEIKHVVDHTATVFISMGISSRVSSPSFTTDQFSLIYHMEKNKFGPKIETFFPQIDIVILACSVKISSETHIVPQIFTKYTKDHKCFSLRF